MQFNTAITGLFVLCLILCTAFSGCVAPPAALPTLAIASPADGATLPAGNITVSVAVTGLTLVDKLGQANVAGEGHIHYFLDANPPTEQGKPAVTAPGTYAATAATSYTWQNVSTGPHRLSVELVRNDHTPLATPVIASVGVSVGSVPADLTNRNSPQAATFVQYPSRTPLTTPQPSLGLQYIAGGFISPMMIVPAVDGSRKTYVVDQTGIVQILTPERTVMAEPFLDVRNRMVPLIGAYDERGLLSMAFHPNYKNNGRLFVYYSAPLRAGGPSDWSCTNILAEYHVMPGNPDKVDMSSEKVILMVDKPYQNHNGGFILFGSDGYLYLPLGDGGRADDTGIGHTPSIGNAQDLSKILGKVIRLDVDNVPSGKTYGIPADNPFVGTAGTLPEIYAYGFRNPAYAAFDAGDGRHLYVWMAGQRLFESAFIVLKGGNYGWNIREGTHCFDPNNDALVPNATCAIAGYRGEPLIGPVVELGHDLGDTIVGGAVYRGTSLAGWQGKMIYGTWSDESRSVGNGTLLVSSAPQGFDLNSLPADAMDLTPADNRMWTTAEIRVANNANGRINAFVRGIFTGVDGEAYLLINQNGGPGLQQGTGEIWKFVPASSANLVDTTTKQLPPSSGGGGY